MVDFLIRSKYSHLESANVKSPVILLTSTPDLLILQK